MKVLKRGADGVRRAITDEAWGTLGPLMRSVAGSMGRPPKTDLREFLEAVIFIDRTGTPWRDLPAAFGNWEAIYRRCRRWEERGNWRRLADECKVPGAARSRQLLVDSTVVRSHPHSAGGPGDAESKAQGRSRGGVGTKVHLAACDEKTLAAATLTGGQAHDAPRLPAVMDDLPEETAATRVVADRAYDSDKLRDGLEDAGFEVVIPARKGRLHPRPHDAEAYKERNQVERLVRRLKSLRRVATRYEKLPGMFLTMVHVAGIASLLC